MMLNLIPEPSLPPAMSTDSVKKSGFHPIGVRVQAVTLMAQGFDIQRVEMITGMSS